jgi:hypothetical protein
MNLSVPDAKLMILRLLRYLLTLIVVCYFVKRRNANAITVYNAPNKLRILSKLSMIILNPILHVKNPKSVEQLMYIIVYLIYYNNKNKGFV